LTDAEAARAAGYRHGVVICIHDDRGRWLMVRRGAGVSRAPLKVAFPGGEVHAGESHRQAAEREAMEELGIRVRATRRVWRHAWDETGWLLEGWLAEWESGEIRADPHEIAEVMWLDEAEAASHPDALVTIGPLLEALRRDAP